MSCPEFYKTIKREHCTKRVGPNDSDPSVLELAAGTVAAPCAPLLLSSQALVEQHSVSICIKSVAEKTLNIIIKETIEKYREKV